jgi:hypothetical protein
MLTSAYYAAFFIHLEEKHADIAKSRSRGAQAAVRSHPGWYRQYLRAAPAGGNDQPGEPLCEQARRGGRQRLQPV